MLAESISLLVTTVKGGDRLLCEGIVASPIRALAFPIEEWQGFVLDAGRVPLTCHVSTAESVGLGASGDHSSGQGRDLPDGSYLKQRLKQAAANILEISTETAFRWPCPVFVSSDPKLTPRIERARINLVLRQLIDLPDVQAYIAYGEFMDRLLKGTQLGSCTHTAKLVDTARASPIDSGQFLPIAFESKSGPIPAVVYLENRVQQNQFDAILYLTDSRAEINPGAALVRSVRWMERECERTSSAVVGRIV